MDSPIVEFAIQQSEQLRAAAAELSRRQEELLNIVNALAGAEATEREAAQLHDANVEALAKAEAQGAMAGGKTTPAAERKAFTTSRDSLDFAAARRKGLDGLRRPAELALSQAENSYALAERNWARTVVNEFIDKIYIPRAMEFLSMINAGIAIACSIGPETARLYQGCTSVRLPVFGHRDLNGSMPDHDRNVWKKDSDAVEIARVLSELRGRQAAAQATTVEAVEVAAQG